MTEHLPFLANSPSTLLKYAISADATSIEVIDGPVPLPAPNAIMVGDDKTTETIHYTVKNGAILGGLTRGYDDSHISDGQGSTYGAARSWPANSIVARNVGAFDLNNLQADVVAHTSEIAAITATLATKATGEVGTDAGDIIALNGEGKLPALDATNLFNVPGAVIVSYMERDENDDLMPVISGNGGDYIECDVINGGYMFKEIV